MKPSQIIESLETLIEIRQPAYITGPAGAGKSQVVYQLQKNLEERFTDFIDLRAILLDPIDLRGVPTIEGGLTKLFKVSLP